MQMRAMAGNGTLGDIRIVDLQDTHGFNAGDDDNASEAQKWRTGLSKSGPTFVLGDIGTDTCYMSEVVLPEMRIKELLCDRQSFIRSRAPLEDNAYVLMHYEGGAVGRLWVSPVNAGSGPLPVGGLRDPLLGGAGKACRRGRGREVCAQEFQRHAVWNPETLFRLRNAVGPKAGLDLDPSHLM